MRHFYAGSKEEGEEEVGSGVGLQLLSSAVCKEEEEEEELLEQFFGEGGGERVRVERVGYPSFPSPLFGTKIFSALHGRSVRRCRAQKGGGDSRKKSSLFLRWAGEGGRAWAGACV